MSSDDALKLMLDHGFELVRSHRHNIVKRGAMKFTLSTTGGVSPWLTNTLLNVCDEIDSKAIRRGERKADTPPLIVRWRAEDWACIGQDPIKWHVQSLTTGHSRWVMKSESEPIFIMPELTKIALSEEPKTGSVAAAIAEAREPVSLPVWSSGPQEPTPAPMPAYEPTPPAPAPLTRPNGNGDTEGYGPVAMALATMRRAIERLTVEVEQGEAILIPKRAQLEGFRQALALMEGTDMQATVPAPKRTILPPTTSTSTGATHRPRADISDADRNTARARWMKGDPVIEIAATLGVTDATIYSWAKKWKTDGYKRK
jgi:hypothetical protein